MKGLLLTLGFLFCFLAGAQAQSGTDSIQRGVHADPRVTTLVNKHAEISAAKKEKGYRVQIYFGADKAKAKEMKARFLGQYSKDAHAYEIYETPNFKIRVGDFRTRLEAYAFLKKIKDDFPTAFIVESDIELDL